MATMLTTLPSTLTQNLNHRISKFLTNVLRAIMSSGSLSSLFFPKVKNEKMKTGSKGLNGGPTELQVLVTIELFSNPSCLCNFYL